MSAPTFDYDGRAVFEGTWTTITSAKSFDSVLLTVPKDATHWVRYTTGGTAALSVGEKLEGGTSKSTCVLVGQAVEVGTAGSNDTGILLIKSPSAAFQAETLTGGTSSGTVAIIQDFIPLRLGLVHPKTAIVFAESYALNVTLSGTTPTVASGTNHGSTLAAGANWDIRGIDNIRNFKCINAVNASGAIMKYVLYF